MANATNPWYSATRNNNRSTPLPQFPAPYGFNTLMLSESSTAMLDMPMPEYVNALQQKLLNLNNAGTFIISATVHAIVTTNNDTVEAHRNDTVFWDSFESSKNDSATRQSTVGPDGQNIDILANDCGGTSSWLLLGFHPRTTAGQAAEHSFHSNALMFNTRRRICDGTWSLTSEKLQLESGKCTTQSPIPDQTIYSRFNEGSFFFSILYPPSLTEFLNPWAPAYHGSLGLWLPPISKRDPWLIPLFTTVVASVYWSRTTAASGYYSWTDKNVSSPPPVHERYNKAVF